MPLHVLLVEDSPAVRDVCQIILERRGFVVQVAADGSEVRALLTGADPPIDLLLTDFELPGIHGKQVAEIVQERWPEVRVVYMSGTARGDVLEPGDVMLAKPFTPTRLLEVIDQVLAS